MLAMDAGSHACLGLVGGEVWNRPGVVTTHHKDRPLSERESTRWLDTAEHAKAVLLPAAMVTSDLDKIYASIAQAKSESKRAASGIAWHVLTQ